MSDPASVGERARLEELAAVTKEYATYSRTAHGAALAGTGAFLVATIAWHVLAHGNAVRVAAIYLLTPTVWLVLIAICRRYYQRHGAVIEAVPMRRSLRRFALGAVYLIAASQLWTVAAVLQHRPEWGGGDDVTGAFLLFSVVFALVALPALAATQARGTEELSWTVLLTASAGWAAGLYTPSPAVVRTFDPPLQIFRWMFIAWMGALAVTFIVVGIRQHFRYRRLERRLAGLKDQA